MKEVIIKSKIVGKEGAIGGGKPIAFPDMSAYALRSDFIRLESSFNDFLGGDDTDNVINRWKELEAFLNNISEDYNLLSLLNGKADKATTLSGYGITDAYTKTNVDNLLKSYVTLGGTQTITGEKNFTGGLKVNGSPIYYDTEKKYWKLEGDLLVTGGVTMYGSDSSFTPSTIMDAIAVDGTTISKSGGVLKVIGGTGGGVADSVAWANITGKPTWIGSTKPSYSYSEITGAISTTELQNYLTQNSYLNVTSGDNRYLKLSGGTISSPTFSPLNIVRESTEAAAIGFHNSTGKLGNLGFNDTTGPKWFDTSYTVFSLLHSGNYSNYALPLSGGEISSTSMSPLTINTSKQMIELRLKSNSSIKAYIGWNTTDGVFLQEGESTAYIGVQPNKTPYYFNGTRYTLWHSGNDGSGSGLDADLLDGYHAIDFTKSININVDNFLDFTNRARFQSAYLSGQGDFCSLVVPTWGGNNSGNWYLSEIRFGIDETIKFRTSHNGSVTTNWKTFAFTDSNVASAYKIIDSSGNDKVYIHTSGFVIVNGFILSSDVIERFSPSYVPLYIQYNNRGNTILNALGGNVGIGTTSPSYKLDVNGVLRATAAMFGGDSGINIGMTYKNDTTGAYDLIERKLSGSMLYLQYNHNGGINMCQGGGNVGIGTASPEYKLAVNGDSVTNNVRTNSVMFGYSDVSSNITSNRWYYASITYADEGKSPSYLNPALVFKTMNNTYQSGTEVERMRICSNGNLSVGYAGDKGSKLYVDGNILAYGGITMYSDQRKKTILNHVELSLKQIAEAPLIEHYYNSDDKKTTHVGSIAQYWAGMNDWFCKLDSEGYYTMEIQNAALASAISIARELDRYETKTDKAIKKLKKRICELEEEVERLKSA